MYPLKPHPLSAAQKTLDLLIFGGLLVETRVEIQWQQRQPVALPSCIIAARVTASRWPMRRDGAKACGPRPVRRRAERLRRIFKIGQADFTMAQQPRRIAGASGIMNEPICRQIGRIAVINATKGARIVQ